MTKELEQLFHEYGNENRLQILKTLSRCRDYAPHPQLQEELDMDLGTLSYNLNVLRKNELVDSIKEGDVWKSKITEKGKKYIQ